MPMFSLLLAHLAKCPTTHDQYRDWSGLFVFTVIVDAALTLAAFIIMNMLHN